MTTLSNSREINLNNSIHPATKDSEILLKNRQTYLMNLARIQLIAAGLMACFYLVCTFLVSSVFGFLLGMVIIGGLTGEVSYRWAKKGLAQVNVASYFFLTTLMLVIAGFVFVIGIEYSAPLIFFWPLMIASLISTVSAILCIAVASSILTTIFLILNYTGTIKGLLPLEGDFARFFHILMWVWMIGLLTAGLIYIVVAFKRINGNFSEEAKRLGDLSVALENQRGVSSEVAQQILSTSSQLNAITHQQKSGLTQQLASVTEVTSSIEELAAAASHIASLAGQVLEAANSSSQKVEPITQQADALILIAEQGLDALQNSRRASRLVAERFVALDQRLSELANNSSELTSVATIIKSIADETHLLALNAAIEAAGAGEYGNRFAVVAQEVKALSDRTIESANEVQEVLSKVSQLLVRASSDAQHGRLDAQQAAQQVVEAAQTISSLTDVITQNASNATEIKEETEAVSLLAEQIDMATRQQRTASDQLVESMHQMQMVAQESAGGTNELTLSVVELENLSTRLVGQLN